MGKGKGWKESEYMQLARSWLHVVGDRAKEKKESRWEAITKHFHNSLPYPKIRSTPTVSHQWYRMKHDIIKFQQYYSAVSAEDTADMTPGAILEAAFDLFAENEADRTFQFLEVWRMLSEDPRWKKMVPVLSKDEEPAEVEATEIVRSAKVESPVDMLVNHQLMKLYSTPLPVTAGQYFDLANKSFFQQHIEKR